MLFARIKQLVSIGALALLALPLGLARADLPPETYEKLRKLSPEVVVFQVRSVHKEWCILCRGDRDIRVQATVSSVVRSKAGLRPGNLLSIRYTHRPLGDTEGPRPIPILKVGKSYTGFLRRISVNKRFGITCRPAARGRSFDLAKK